MIPRTTFTSATVALLLAGCSTPKSQTHEGTPEAIAGGEAGTAVLLYDPMTGDWRENWFLDGKKATVRTSEDGLFFSGGTVTKRDDPEEYHAHHAVLWTKDVFEGDLRITFEMTREDESDYGNTLLYMYAQGVGYPPYEEDIAEWSELRDIPNMGLYFSNMDLLSLSFRHNLRARRYPLRNHPDPDTEATGGTMFPYVDYIGMIPGKTYLVEVEKRGPDLTLRLFDKETGEEYADYTWNTRKLGEDGEKKAPVLTKGRIGLRHMSTKQFTYKDFKVERL